MIFVIENNQWGLSTPSKEQFNCKQFIDKGIGYGMETMQIDGNKVDEVYMTIQKIKEKQKVKPEPFLVEAISFRMRGHEEASGTKYYPKGLQEEWSQKDPITHFEEKILNKKLLKKSEIEEIKVQLKKKINEAWKKAERAPKIIPNQSEEIKDIYASYAQLNEIKEHKNISEL